MMPRRFMARRGIFPSAILLMGVIALLCPGGGWAAEVNIPDPALDFVVHVALGFEAGTPLQDTDLATLTTLSADGQAILDLTGIEYCTSLDTLQLAGNGISDLTPLAGLVNLTLLDLGFNQIADITPLAGMNALADLALGHNLLSDVSPLSGLSGLTRLGLSGNQIADISSLAGLTLLDSLELDENEIIDVSPISALPNLTVLHLDHNHVLDISSFTALASIDSLFLSNNLISDLGSLSGLTDHLSVLDVTGNPLSEEACTVQIPDLEMSEIIVSTSEPCFEAPVAVVIPDAALEDALRVALGKPVGQLFNTDLATLTSLFAPDRSIFNLTGLEYCSNLAELDLSNLATTDLAPLAGLTSLTYLDLSQNSPETKINDITALAEMGGMIELHLDGNRISDITALSGMEALRNLNLSNNLISDLSPLSGHAALRTLVLSGNQIENLVPLAGVTDLTGLHLDGNLISDITALSGMTGLEYLNLSNNLISDLSPLSGDQALTTLVLRANQIVDIAPLGAMAALTELDLSTNQIADLGPLAGLTSLTELAAHQNQISDLTPLFGLNGLDYLDLASNPVCDLTTLVVNLGIGDSDLVYLEDTLLGTAACSMHIAALEGRGATVFTGGACVNGGIAGDCELPVVNDFYISASEGNDTSGDCSPGGPCRTIQRVLNQVATYDSPIPVTVHLEPGDYPEVISMLPNIRIEGSGQGVTRIVPPLSKLLDAAVRGADDCSLESLSIVLPDGAPDGTQVLAIVQASMAVNDVELDGNLVPDSIGLYVHGENSSATVIKDCLIHRVGFGLDAAFSNAKFAFNNFEFINGDAAVRILQPRGATPLVGDVTDLVNSGSNIFNHIDGQFFTTFNVDGTALAQANAWNNLTSEAAVIAQTGGAVDVASPLYRDTTKDGILLPNVYVTVRDDATQCPVSSATVTLNADIRVPVLESPVAPSVYLAQATPTGQYTLRIQKQGYEEYVQLLKVDPGDKFIDVKLTPLAAAGGNCSSEGAVEGDGEGYSTPDVHTGDPDQNGEFSLSELLVVIAIYNSISFSCGTGIEPYQIGPAGGHDCQPHGADFEGGAPDWKISLTELLRMIQFFNLGGYHRCVLDTEDDYCPGPV